MEMKRLAVFYVLHKFNKWSKVVSSTQGRADVAPPDMHRATHLTTCRPIIMAINVLLNDSPRSSCSSYDPDYGRVEGQGTWTIDEHHRFLHGLSLYPHGPWRNVAAIVKTRTVRQTRTHAQKLKQKQARHIRGLRNKSSINEEIAVYRPVVMPASEPSIVETLDDDESDEIDGVPSLDESLDYFMHVLSAEILLEV
ncbi:Aste57867_20589 [Aphanomyces stellatus]|uniref:Aste57867_20589 protein n=1 Tax=Aphanomyces stellatus TaxID=120398 RepID=A0A485LFW7_9STRA|nr:hypothetical protein As57867_020522 [Aphanomyces stellatus]VFT97270.1 Aste57867_20589 [Aphanomyces stellatus]